MRTTQKTSPGRSLEELAAATGDLAPRVAAAAMGARADREVDGLDAAATLLEAIDLLTAAVVTVMQTTEHAQVIVDHGVTRDTWLRAIAGRTGSDAGMLLAAAERLADMPAVMAWFHEGALSWGAVRRIVAATRNLTAAQRAWVDATLTEHAPDISRLDDDQVAAAVDGLANQARPDLHRDREANALTRRWLSLQPRLDGTADICGTLDPETAAAALAAFATTPANHSAGNGDDEIDDDEGMSGGDRVRATKRRANVDVFGDLCRQRLTRRRGERGDTSTTGGPAVHSDREPTSGDTAETTAATPPAGSTASGGSCDRCGAAPSSARPAFLVVADLATLDPDDPTGSGSARLLWATARGPVELTAAAAQRLGCDATLRAVVTHGTQILGVTAAHPKVSATLRAALVVRDGGCRFPGCAQAPDVCDNHHVVPVIRNGPTVLENLALLCRDHHHTIHDSGWHVTLAADGSMAFNRRGVALTSLSQFRQHPRATVTTPTGRPGRRRPRSTDPEPGSDAGREPDPAVDVGRSDRDPAGALLPF